jgi:hypothetical protein
MSNLELIRALYAYNQWANGHVLDPALKLTEDEFSREQGGRFESVEGNLAHIVGARRSSGFSAGLRARTRSLYWNTRRCAGWQRSARRLLSRTKV